MNKIIDKLTKSRDEALSSAKWNEKVAAERREEARLKIISAEKFEENAKGFREEVDQYDKALKALQETTNQDDFESFYQTVGDLISAWRSRQIGLDECQASIIRAHDAVGVD